MECPWTMVQLRPRDTMTREKEEAIGRQDQNCGRVVLKHKCRCKYSETIEPMFPRTYGEYKGETVPPFEAIGTPLDRVLPTDFKCRFGVNISQAEPTQCARSRKPRRAGNSPPPRSGALPPVGFCTPLNHDVFNYGTRRSSLGSCHPSSGSGTHLSFPPFPGPFFAIQ
jgi:hypothetical protein